MVWVRERTIPTELPPLPNENLFVQMRAVGLWQYCINISIAILDIIHRPVFFF
jgi:hypothetical protein